MSGELRINKDDSFKRVGYLIKQELKEKKELSVSAGIYSSLTATRVSEYLQRLGFVTFSDVNTTTKVIEGKRRITLTINLQKTKDFDKLMEEQEERKKQYMEERENRMKENSNTTPNA